MNLSRMTSVVRPICSLEQPKFNDFCRDCGCRLKEKPKRMLPTSEPDPKKPSVFESVNACYLDSAPFTFKMLLFHRVIEGETKITFCPCAKCNLLYREHLAVMHLAETNEILEASDPEIVRKVYKKDLSQVKIEFSKKNKHEKTTSEQPKEREPAPSTTTSAPSMRPRTLKEIMGESNSGQNAANPRKSRGRKKKR